MEVDILLLSLSRFRAIRFVPNHGSPAPFGCQAVGGLDQALTALEGLLESGSSAHHSACTCLVRLDLPQELPPLSRAMGRDQRASGPRGDRDGCRWLNAGTVTELLLDRASRGSPGVAGASGERYGVCSAAHQRAHRRRYAVFSYGRTTFLSSNNYGVRATTRQWLHRLDEQYEKLLKVCT